MRQASMPVRSLPTLQKSSTGCFFSAASVTTCTGAQLKGCQHGHSRLSIC